MGCFIETVPLSELKYASMSGYNLWHQRMGHYSPQSIKVGSKNNVYNATVVATGLEEQENKKVEAKLDCASWKDRAVRPLERVHMDLRTGGTTLLEGYYQSPTTRPCFGEFMGSRPRSKDDANALFGGGYYGTDIPYIFLRPRLRR
jgi:hypothetical protein